MQNSFTTKGTELLTDGVSVAFHQIIKPRIRPMLLDAFRNVDYSISTAEAAEALEDDEDSEEDLVPTRFTTSWTSLTKPLKRIMTKPTWNRLLAKVLPEVAASLERRLWGMNGRLSELGATKLERDVSGIVAAACGEGKYGLRDCFGRCAQIIMVAGMEEEEWEEVEAEVEGEGEEGGIVWVLGREERGRARGLLLK